MPRSQSRTDKALALLHDLLAGPQYPLNSRLPPERQLAVDLGVSRAALRGALELLEAEGLLWRHVGQGTFVGSRPIRNKRDLMLVSGGTNPAEVMEVRLHLEPLLARLAALRASEDEIGNMKSLLRKSELATEVKAYERWDGTLHRAIAAAAHNSLLLGLFDAVNAVRSQTVWGKLQELALTAGGQRRYWEHHHQVVNAIAERDGLAAERLMRLHIESVRANMFSTEEEARAQPPPRSRGTAARPLANGPHRS